MNSAAVHVEATDSAFTISAPEVLLLAVGVVFTLVVFAVFVIVLRKELKRDERQQESSPDR